MNSYRIYHLGAYLCSFTNRDDALNWIVDRVTEGSNFGDFEILDGSDFL